MASTPGGPLTSAGIGNTGRGVPSSAPSGLVSEVNARLKWYGARWAGDLVDAAAVERALEGMPDNTIGVTDPAAYAAHVIAFGRPPGTAHDGTREQGGALSTTPGKSGPDMEEAGAIRPDSPATSARMINDSPATGHGDVGPLTALQEDADRAAEQAAADIAAGSLLGAEWSEYCLSMAANLIRRRRPDWNTGMPQDDLAGAVKSTRRYLDVPATVWAPVTDWVSLARDVVKAGPNAAAVVRIDRPYREQQVDGHAVVLIQTSDPDRPARQGEGPASRLYLIDPTTPGHHVITDVTALAAATDHRSGDDAEAAEPGDLLGDVAGEAAQHLLSLSEARALIIDAQGRPTAPTATPAPGVRALTDPTSRRVAAMGGEGELRQYEIYFPEDLDKKLKFHSDYSLFHSHYLNGITDHSFAGDRQIRVLEMVTNPSAIHRGDTGRVDRQGLLTQFRRVTQRLEKMALGPDGVPLTEVLGEGFTFTDIGRRAMIRRVRFDGPLTLAPQWTVGVPITAVYDFLRYVQTQAPPAPMTLSDDHLGPALEIADDYRSLFLSEKADIPSDELPEFLLEAIREDNTIAALGSYLSLLYLQFAGVVHSNSQPMSDARNIPKNYVTVASRTSMHGIRKRLPFTVRRYLDRHKTEIKQRFSESIKRTIDHPGDPLAIKRDGFDVEKFLDYSLSDGLIANETTITAIDQNKVLNVRNNSIEMDDNRGRLSLPLVLLEVRKFGPHLVSTRTFESIYLKFETLAAELYDQVEQGGSLNLGKLGLAQRNAPFRFFISMLQEARALNALQSQESEDGLALTMHDVLPLIQAVVYAVIGEAARSTIVDDLRLLARQVEALQPGDRAHQERIRAASRNFRKLISALTEPLVRVSLSFPSGTKDFRKSRAGELTAFVASVVRVATSRPLRVHIEGGGDRDRLVSRLWTSEWETGLTRARQVELVMREMVTQRLLEAGLPADRVSLVPSSRGSDASASGGPVPETAAWRRRVIAWIEPDMGYQHDAVSITASGHGGAGRGSGRSHPGAHTARPSYGLARVADPVADRLAPGAAIVVRPDSAYARRRDGRPREETLRHVTAVPDTGGGGGGLAGDMTTTPSRGQEPGFRARLGPDKPFLFERRLEEGTSSTDPWLSYTVTKDGHLTDISLPDGGRVPGEGWYRHGPLFLHPGEYSVPAGADAQGWVLFGDTGWVGRIDNTGELFAESALQGMFDPGTAPRYRISATPAGLYLTPEDRQDEAIHLPWQETLPATGPNPRPSRTDPRPRTGPDTDPAAITGQPLREPGRPQVHDDQGTEWFTPSYSAFDAEGEPVPPELQACVSVTVLTVSRHR